MKIQIQGNIIETEYIYRIGDIYRDYELGGMKGVSKIIFRFDIYFMDGKDSVSVINKIDMGNENMELLNKEKLSNLRDKLIECWNASPSKIRELLL